MELRLIEVHLAGDLGAHVQTLISDLEVLSVRSETQAGPHTKVTVLVPASSAQAVLDRLQDKLGDLDDFQVLVIPVEASLPLPQNAAEAEPGGSETNDRPPGGSAISREELVVDIAESARFSRVHMAMVVLSTIVAAIGLLRDNLAIIVGAMVIVPLLGPSMALALATTLGDRKLAGRAIVINATGVALVLCLSVLIGFWFPVDPALKQIALRTRVGLDDVALALAAGTAGSLAFTTGLSTALVGVMVAVALLPPLVSAGLLAGSGQWAAAWGTTLLFLANFIGVNLAGVTTFWVRGVRPTDWQEAHRAGRSTLSAVSVWTLLLISLVALILVSR